METLSENLEREEEITFLMEQEGGLAKIDKALAVYDAIKKLEAWRVLEPHAHDVTFMSGPRKNPNIWGCACRMFGRICFQSEDTNPIDAIIALAEEVPNV